MAATGFARFLADLFALPNPPPGSMAAEIQAAAAREGITDAGMARLIEELRGDILPEPIGGSGGGRDTIRPRPGARLMSVPLV